MLRPSKTASRRDGRVSPAVRGNLFARVAGLAAAWLAVAALAAAAEPPRSATPPASIRAAAGFSVELVRSAQEGEDSWISMTFDDRGRVIVGLDAAGVARLAPPAAAGGEWSFTRLDATLAHCRGVLFHEGSLYVNATDSKELWRFDDPRGDGSFPERTRLGRFDYRSRYGHGQNQLQVGPDGAVHSIVGNDVSFPEGTSAASPYRDPRNDRLLADPADAGHDDRVGHLLRFDRDGRSATVVAGGMRNQVDADWNDDGEWFTWDADMEWDVGQPWYRPTRLTHVVSGGEYGWRWGTMKWPPSYPDSLPPTLETGLGSPTGVVFGRRGRFPGRWREALYMADWQHGRILAAFLAPAGASYTATDEVFVEGAPLNVCDMAFGPDGGLWFITGGRRSQSGLYRVSFTGDAAAVPAAAEVDPEAAAAARRARDRRRALEAFHAAAVPGAIDDLWPDLGSADRWLRFAARLGLERQPLEQWRERARSERHALRRGEALLAWMRIAEPAERPEVVRVLLDGAASAAADAAPPPEAETLLLLRPLAIALARGVELPPAEMARLRGLLDRLDGHPAPAVQREICELLVAARADRAVGRLLERLDRAVAQEEQIHVVHALARWPGPWTAADHRRLLAWFVRARSFRGGHLLAKILARLEDDIRATITEDERPTLAAELAALAAPAAAAAPAEPAPFVRQWTAAEIEAAVAGDGAVRDAAAGRRALARARCLACHSFGGVGTAVGPDLTAVGRRFDARALLESILEPSRVVDPKYHATTWVLASGRSLTGRAAMVNAREIVVEVDPLSGRAEKIPRDEIESSHPSPVSPMPAGLLDVLGIDEILDLLAVLRAGPG
jgi:putative heme-binding domain-containing protein